ncbi:tyrosine-protein phosphatase [Lentilactobacillus hilgardii]|uniref:tyrosine-protein phosphatase n=1 Tax=Lentilactobacillus hilgardii TaxID=1588 RepID=UPI0021A308F6|nr:tyrosine-protein phosphatase [Lentilactobacillus hilgardii]MCT3392068.1 tyrosine-protein phosphatase [Lentilactobacillus hilgardii]
MKNNSAAFATSTSSFEAGAIPISESQGVQIKTLAPTKSEADHEIKLEGAFNVRDLGGFVTKDGRRIKDHLLLRSARLNHLTKNDIQVLTHQYNVGIDFDLRRPQEVAEAPDMKMPGVKYINDSVDTDESFHYHINDRNNRKHYRSYISNQRAREAYHDLFMTLLNANDKAVLWHCASGKDRTGLGGALIMYVLGVDMATIFDDYDASNDFLRAHNMKRLEALKTAGASRDELELARVDGGVDRSYLHVAFDEVKKEFGSIDAYLVNGLRISKRQQRKLRKQYLI